MYRLGIVEIFVNKGIDGKFEPFEKQREFKRVNENNSLPSFKPIQVPKPDKQRLHQSW